MTSKSAFANDKLIENLETQLQRLVSQLKDLEECKDELPPDEIDGIKDETVEQIKEFKETLDRMQKGDTTLETKVSQMRNQIRSAIATAFNTNEMIKMFGEQDLNELLNQLNQLEEDYKLKRINLVDMQTKKVNLLQRLQKQGHTLSAADSQFLDETSQIYLQAVENDEE